MKTIFRFLIVPAIMVACVQAATPDQKRAAAVSSYSAMLADCLARARVDMADQGEESRQKARAQYDACADRTDALWAKDGGK